jgi:hypothetical protein
MVIKLENTTVCTYYWSSPLLPSGPPDQSRLNSALSGVGLSAALLTVAEMGKDPWGGMTGLYYC